MLDKVLSPLNTFFGGGAAGWAQLEGLFALIRDLPPCLCMLILVAMNTWLAEVSSGGAI
jgi:hypothetical protein